MKQPTDEVDLFSSLAKGNKPFRNIKLCTEQANRLLICQSHSVYIKKNNMWWEREALLPYLTTVSNLSGMECSSSPVCQCTAAQLDKAWKSLKSHIQPQPSRHWSVLKLFFK